MQTQQREAVETAIALMRSGLDGDLAITDLARSVALSRSHFSRLFTATTGLSPARFLTALRVREAQRLLTSTSWSVTAITHRVGYDGIGTFSSRFGSIVGLPPSRYRAGDRLVREPVDAGSALRTPRATRTTRATRTVHGRVHGGDGAVIVGTFDRPAIHGRPRNWTITGPGGAFRLDDVGDGACWLLARSLSDDSDTALRGVGGRIGAVAGSKVRCDVVVRPPHPIDPPALSALPVSDR